jgi:predicted nuclease of predicted toxin-antitoxin system
VKFLFDHDVPDEMAYGLEALGHEVFKLRELTPPDGTDEQVMRLAAERVC